MGLPVRRQQTLDQFKKENDMPHFSPADLLRQKSMTPASYEHTQAAASALWTVNHFLDLPGTPTVLAYDANGT